MEQIEYIVRTTNLSKRYKNQYALNKVNMNIARGDIYGFVGENGSGKTTIIRILTGLIYPTEGTYELFGIENKNPNILKVRNKIGAVVETPSIYKNLSAYDNLKMQCDILGIKDYDSKIREILETVGLNDLYNNKKLASQFSLGMRQRLGIGMALLGNLEFLILDEPMNGLDPTGIVEIRELILKLNKEKNITFLISSHILSELSLVATKYGIISKGKLLKEITSEELKKELRKSLIVEVSNLVKACDILKDSQLEIEVKDGKIVIYDYVSIEDIIMKLVNNKISILKINCEETNIENYYLSLIGGGYHA